jgi:hypothetical protein
VGAGLSAPVGKLCVDGAFTCGRMRESISPLATSTGVGTRAGKFAIAVGEAGLLGPLRVDFSFSKLQWLSGSGWAHGRWQD